MADEKRSNQSVPSTEQSVPPMPTPEPVPQAERTVDAPGSGAAVAERPSVKPGPQRVDQLPPWQVLLHNDDENELMYVVQAMIDVAMLRGQQAMSVVVEADKRGVALVCTTHREKAELLQEQLTSKGLTVTIEAAR